MDKRIYRHLTRHLYLHRIKTTYMASIKAILNKEKPVEKDEKIKDKTFPIYIRLHHKQKRKYVSIGRWVKESQWDEEAGLVRKSHTDYVAINAIITKEKKRLNDEVLWHLATEESTDVISGIRKREKKETLNNFFIGCVFFPANKGDFCLDLVIICHMGRGIGIGRYYKIFHMADTMFMAACICGNGYNISGPESDKVAFLAFTNSHRTVAGATDRGRLKANDFNIPLIPMGIFC